MMSKTDVTEAVLSLEVFHGGAKFIDANHNQLWHIFQPILFQLLIVSLSLVQLELGGDCLEEWD